MYWGANFGISKDITGIVDGRSVTVLLLQVKLTPSAFGTPRACAVPSSLSQADCLLHGHSYTAHPVGCAAAVEYLSQVSP